MRDKSRAVTAIGEVVEDGKNDGGLMGWDMIKTSKDSTMNMVPRLCGSYDMPMSTEGLCCSHHQRFAPLRKGGYV
jgi:hypothetical protein